MEDRKIFCEKNVIDFAETKLTHFSGEEYLGEKIIMYNQVHLAVSYKGDLENYLGIAKLRLSRKALEKGCVMAVDGHYYQDNVQDGSVIFAATGLRSFKESFNRTPIHNRNSNSEIKRKIFAEENMTHISTKHFLERILFNPEDYKSNMDIYLDYKGEPEEDYIHLAELNLADIALKQNCNFVTQIDYTKHDPKKASVSISATGLKRY
jgi:hypothetical protein